MPKKGRTGKEGGRSFISVSLSQSYPKPIKPEGRYQEQFIRELKYKISDEPLYESVPGGEKQGWR